MKSLPSKIVKSPQVQLAGTVPIDNTMRVCLPLQPGNFSAPHADVGSAAPVKGVLSSEDEIDTFLNPFSSLWEMPEMDDEAATSAEGSAQEHSADASASIHEAALEFRDRCKEMLTIAFKARDRLLKEAEVEAQEQIARAKAAGADTINEAQQEVRQLTAQTDLHVKKQLDDAAKQAVVLLEQAKKDGYAQGYGEGKAQAQQECAGALTSAKALTDGIRAEKDALLRSYEQELTETALGIAEKILLHEIRQESAHVRDILRQAAKNFRSADHLTIRVSSLDVSEEVFSDLSFIQEIVGNDTHIDIELANDVESGTVILDDGREILDASVNTQLQMIREIAEGRRAEAARNEEGVGS